MLNRFEELRTAVSKYDATIAEEMKAVELKIEDPLQKNTHLTIDIKPEIQNDTSSAPNYMEDFYEKVAIVKKVFHEIDKNTNNLKGLKNKSMQTVDEEESKDIRHEVSTLVDATNTLITKAKKALDNINGDTEALSRREGENSEMRIRRNATLALTRKFKEVLSVYQSIQTEFNTQTKTRLKRQMQYVYPELSGEEMETVVEEGIMTAGEAMRTKMAVKHQSLNNAVADISDKYRGIQRIERSMVELHQLFVDLATMVEYQGEQLDQIEYSVLQAKDYTANAGKHLVQARKNQAASSKMWLTATIILAVLAAVILMIIFL